MQAQKEQDIEFFEQLTDEPLPKIFDRLKVQETAEIRQFVEGVLEKERAGLDNLFESMSQTLKFIPNFFLHALTVRYISPPVAARITVKLAFKQVLSIAKGLPPEHIGETAVYLDSDYAASLLEDLPKNNARNMIEYLMQAHPLPLLDMLFHANESVFKLVEPTESFLAQNTSGMSELRLAVLEKLQAV